MSSYDEDDEDAFLYGNASAPAPSAPSSVPGGGLGKEGSPSTSSPAGVSGDASTVNPPISLTENGTASVGHENGHERRGELEEDDDDEAMDESDGEDEEQQQQAEESDDDLEIIIDTNPSGPPQSHNFSRQVGAVPAQPIPPPVAQAQLQQQATPAPSQPQFLPAKQESVGPARSTPNPFLTFPSTTRQTGAPIPTPARVAAPDVNNASAVFSQRSGSAEPDAAPLDFKPIVQPIIDVDLDSIEEKNWRKPGANLADYFNYGFDEPSWKAWAARQSRSREDRERERENPFSIFANRPLPEAWNSLPMELKGMMMQTIMTSFNAQAGGGGMQNGGMNMGMQGMQGMMPGNMAGPGSMGMNPMAGMGGNPMMNQMQQQGMGGGMSNGMNGFGGQGGMNMSGADHGNMGNNMAGMNPMMAQMQQQFGGGGGMGMGMGMGMGGGNNTPNPQMQMQQRGR